MPVHGASATAEGSGEPPPASARPDPGSDRGWRPGAVVWTGGAGDSLRQLAARPLLRGRHVTQARSVEEAVVAAAVPGIGIVVIGALVAFGAGGPVGDAAGAVAEVATELVGVVAAVLAGLSTARHSVGRVRRDAATITARRTVGALDPAALDGPWRLLGLQLAGLQAAQGSPVSVDADEAGVYFGEVLLADLRLAATAARVRAPVGSAGLSDEDAAVLRGELAEVGQARSALLERAEAILAAAAAAAAAVVVEQAGLASARERALGDLRRELDDAVALAHDPAAHISSRTVPGTRPAPGDGGREPAPADDGTAGSGSPSVNGGGR